MDSSLHSSSPKESTWQADMEELIAAARAYMDLCNGRDYHENVGGFPFTPKICPPGVSRLWVKVHAGGPTLRGECDTQEYVHNEITKRDWPTGHEVYVPKVYAYAEFDMEEFPHSCILMEFVTGTPLSTIMESTLWSRDLSEPAKKEVLRPYKDRVAHFLSFLLSLEPPPDAAPAPVNGGRMKNFVFGRDDSDGPCIFETLEQLQDWVNQENEKVRCRKSRHEALTNILDTCRSSSTLISLRRPTSYQRASGCVTVILASTTSCWKTLTIQIVD